jgi:hypothetical protein
MNLYNSIFLFEDFKEETVKSLKEKYPNNLNDINKLIASKLNVKFFEHILNIKGTEPIEDVISTIKTFVQYKDALKARGLDTVLFNYKTVNDIRDLLNSFQTKKEKREQIRNNSATTIYESDKWLVIMPHNTEASCIYGADTTWCTAATKGQNMFLNYVAAPEQNVILYYFINKKGNPKLNPKDKFGIGFINGKPFLKKLDGSITVDAKNNGLDDKDIKKILGNEYDKIIKLLEIHAEQLENKHPAKNEMNQIAESYKLYKAHVSKMNDREVKEEFNWILFGYPNINKDTALEIIEEDYFNLDQVENFMIRISDNQNDYTQKFKNLIFFHPYLETILRAIWFNMKNDIWEKILIDYYKEKLKEKSNKQILEFFKQHQIYEIIDQLITITPEETVRLIETLQENYDNENLYQYAVGRNNRFVNDYVRLPKIFEFYLSYNMYKYFQQKFQWYKERFPNVSHILSLTPNDTKTYYDNKNEDTEEANLNDSAIYFKRTWVEDIENNFYEIVKLTNIETAEFADAIYNFYYENKFGIANRFGIKEKAYIKWKKSDFI